jgi:rfaE bifunctional protein nucleotidyltransferase chain/domain
MATLMKNLQSMRRGKPMIGTVREIADSLRGARIAGARVVSATGCFDLLHVGHLFVLESAAILGEILVVGVNSDRRVRVLKGPRRPIIPAADRMRMLAALRCVHSVFEFDEDTPAEALAVLRPDIHTKGAGWSAEMPETEVVRSYGGRIEIIDGRIESTSDIISRVIASHDASVE